MSLPTPQFSDERIFQWLGNDVDGVPYYLQPLNLAWSSDGAEHDLKHYQAVASKLAADPAYWAQNIRAPNWRNTLAACVCLLVSGRHDFFDDLCYRFCASSFVSPQIGVTLGLLHGPLARSFFKSALQAQTLRLKQAYSAHYVLLRLGVEPGDEYSVPEAQNDLERDDAVLADRVVTAHWNFWASRVPGTDT